MENTNTENYLQQEAKVMHLIEEMHEKGLRIDMSDINVSKREHSVAGYLRQILRENLSNKMTEVRGERDWLVITVEGKEYKIQIYEVGE